MFLMVESVKRIIVTRSGSSEGVIGIGVMLVSILLTFGLVAFQRYVIKRSRSLAIKAESLHYASDLMMNFGVIVALVVTGLFGVPYVDPVDRDHDRRSSSWMARGGSPSQSFDMVMDHEFPD